MNVNRNSGKGLSIFPISITACLSTGSQKDSVKTAQQLKAGEEVNLFSADASGRNSRR